MLSRVKFVVVLSSTLLTALLLIGAFMAESSSADNAYRQIAVYTEVLYKIKSEYVEDPDMKAVGRGALQGLLESLDAYSAYLTADEFKEYQKRKGRQDAGLGLVISKRFGHVMALSSLPGSPAAKAGLQAGDLLESVDGRAARDLPLPLVEVLLGGQTGSTVRLVVRRSPRTEEPVELTLTRSVIAPPSVGSRMLADKVGYLDLKALNGGKAGEVARAVRQLTEQGAERLLLDLRNNSLGDHQEAIKVANLFVDEGLLAYLEGQKFPRKQFQAEAGHSVSKLPLVVMTNRATSGAAELLAAAILDRQRGQVVGERTFGQCAEQKTFPVEDGAAVILSIAKCYRPSGKAIQDGGVNPTLLVSETGADTGAEEDPGPEPPERSPETDEILKKAIEVVKGALPRAA